MPAHNATAAPVLSVMSILSSVEPALSKAETTLGQRSPETPESPAERSGSLPSIELRLRERFPGAGHDRIRSCVDEAAITFAGARVQQFLPVLIERQAAEALYARTEIDRT